LGEKHTRVSLLKYIDQIWSYNQAVSLLAQLRGCLLHMKIHIEDRLKVKTHNGFFIEL